MSHHAFVLDGSRLRDEPRALPALGAADVIVRADGIALGALGDDAPVAGVVVDAGEAARHLVGQRVVVPRVLPCGECDRCRRAQAALCPNRAARAALATHERVPARPLLVVEPPLWPEGASLWQLAALPDAVGAPFGALMRVGLEPGSPLVVVGAGARARAAIAIGVAKGATVLAVTDDPDAASRAHATGARAIVLPGDADAAVGREALAAAAREAEVSLASCRVLETSGSSSGRARALALAPAGAAIALLDGADGPAPPGPADAAAATLAARIASDELLIVGAAACHPDLLVEAVALVVRGELALAPLVGEVTLAEAATASADYAAGRRATLPVLIPSTSR
jgi:6-hydroxycyclohex-1-ene-1-carbonyl-CoA dehydrogenase